MDLDLSRYLTITEAAEACGMKRPNLSNLIAKGIGPEPLIVGKDKYFDPDEVRRWKGHYERHIKRRKHAAK